MPRPFALVLAPLFLALLVLGPATRSGRAEDAPGAEPAPAKPSDDARFLPLEAIKPGMRGYGMTVRHGTALERFEVEVIDIARNWLTKQDLILVRCLGDDHLMTEFASHGGKFQPDEPAADHGKAAAARHPRRRTGGDGRTLRPEGRARRLPAQP